MRSEQVASLMLLACLLPRRSQAEPPSAELVALSKSFRQEGEIRLYCNAESGSQPLQFDWTFNQAQLQTDAAYSIVDMSRESSALVVRRARPSNSGNYSCRVSNGFGQSRSSLWVNVEGGQDIHLPC